MQRIYLKRLNKNAFDIELILLLKNYKISIDEMIDFFGNESICKLD